MRLRPQALQHDASRLAFHGTVLREHWFHFPLNSCCQDICGALYKIPTEGQLGLFIIMKVKFVFLMIAKCFLERVLLIKEFTDVSSEHG